HHLAGATPRADRLRAPDRAGILRADQAVRFPARTDSRSLREACRENRGGRARRRDSPRARRRGHRRGLRQRGQARAEEGAQMTSFLLSNIAPLMFCTLVIVLLLGYPVAFSLAAVGVAFAVIGIKLGLLGPELIQALPERLWGVMSND